MLVPKSTGKLQTNSSCGLDLKCSANLSVLCFSQGSAVLDITSGGNMTVSSCESPNNDI